MWTLRPTPMLRLMWMLPPMSTLLLTRTRTLPLMWMLLLMWTPLPTWMLLLMWTPLPMWMLPLMSMLLLTPPLTRTALIST
ncbi:hypothetical protein [Plantibacter sp. Leaf171]|uniref:hypothetical protein n=1 Tax=Plantibacter sp. Leaf171 TaxID=1736284 RepID=UPI000703427F|nr:hypothetical protein [Plantibacter sp. Leaf171]KQM17618.1 hypothetical protein ASE44_00345 [Plantibacter sp. Leaf1]